MKLTNWTRECIRNRALAHAFDPRFAVLKQAEHALGMEAYESLFPAHELRPIARIDAKWFVFDGCLRFNVVGEDLKFNVKPAVRVPDTARGYCQRLGSIAEGDLATRMQAHARLVEQTNTERRSALDKLKALLNSVSTAKQLETVWPEGVPFFDFDKPAPASPIAIRTDEINKALGL